MSLAALYFSSPCRARNEIHGFSTLVRTLNDDCRVVGAAAGERSELRGRSLNHSPRRETLVSEPDGSDWHMALICRLRKIILRNFAPQTRLQACTERFHYGA
jgi:hypothetical protein